MAAATRIVTFGCELGDLRPAAPIDRWDDVPAVSEGYDAARAAIDARLERLVAELARET